MEKRSRPTRVFAALGLVAPLLAPGLAAAGPKSVAGLCPDGSAFIVSKREDAPCARAKFVDEASELPPLKPNYLPKPYTWYIEQEANSENNPYNVLERAQKLRELQAKTRAAGQGSATASGSNGAPGLQTMTARAPISAEAQAAPVASRTASPLALEREELEDLVQLVALRQQVAPATLALRDASEREQLFLRVAYSPAFEARALSDLGLNGGSEAKRVFLFSARSAAATEFFPNFLVVQDGVTFRPEPEDPREQGFLVGEAGTMDKGVLNLGYLVVPARFDPTRPLEIWWNDRSMSTTLAPGE
jgi:hypothetical protein